MIITLKNKDTLIVDDFRLKCCIGKSGLKKNKIEGDGSTPVGKFSFGKLYWRKDRINKPKTSLKCVKINHDMGWCNDVRFPQKYNKLIKREKKYRHEKLKRKDYKYDLFIPIKYNFKKPVAGKGSCIFLHLTKNYKPTTGCIALKVKDFLIMLRLIKKNSIIKII